MFSGYGNCYLKNNPNAATPRPNDDGIVVHSAIITQDFFQKLDVTCEDSTTYTSLSGHDFEVSCYNSRQGSQNSSSIRATSLGACADECLPGADPKCLGVVYDMGMLRGLNSTFCGVLTALCRHARWIRELLSPR